MKVESNIYKVILILLLAISLSLSFIGIMIAIILRLPFPIIGIILIIIKIIAIAVISSNIKYSSILALIIGIIGIVSNTIELFLYFHAWSIFYLIFDILIIIFAILEFNQLKRYQQIGLQAPTPIQQTVSPQQAATTEKFNYCTNCGVKVTGNFCEHCGTKLT